MLPCLDPKIALLDSTTYKVSRYISLRPKPGFSISSLKLESVFGINIEAYTLFAETWKGCVQNCREIEIIERWNHVPEIIETWKQVSEIVEKHFPVKSSSQNLREIEFVENMRVSFTNCREIWKQVPEIVVKGGFFSIYREQDKIGE